MTLNCPSDAQLHSFFSDDSTATHSCTISYHLKRCEFCKNRAQVLQASEHIPENKAAAVSDFPSGDFGTEEFLQRLVSSGLMNVGDADSVVSSLPAQPQSGDDLAVAFINAEALTEYQAACLRTNETSWLIVGDYEILRAIGHGGMGQVFQARHRRMDRIVAIKMLPRELLHDEEAVKRFEQEIKAAANLQHEHIVHAYFAGLHNGRHFLVMEYIDGGDLSAIVKRDGALAKETAVDYIMQAAEGFEYAHLNGRIHRDIKPGNLMIENHQTAFSEVDSTDENGASKKPDGRGKLKILDLGLARVIETSGERLTATGELMGTFNYMAPEQAEDSRLADVRSDIYSLGCTLYRLLTAKAVFPASSLVERINAHAKQPCPSLVDDANVSIELNTLFRSMLAKKPQDRPQTMTEVIQRLAECPECTYTPETLQQQTSAKTQPTNRRLSPISFWMMVTTALIALFGFAINYTRSGNHNADIAHPSLDSSVAKPLAAETADPMTPEIANESPDENPLYSDVLVRSIRSQLLLPAPSIPTKSGGGYFLDSGQRLGAESTAMCTESGDLDGDGDIDVIVANREYGDPESPVWLNNGDGTFELGEMTGPTESNRCVALGDLDADGDLDAVFATKEQQPLVWLNDGSAHFVAKGTETEATFDAVALGDLDLDGDLDFVLTGEGPGEIWLNDGEANFERSEFKIEAEESEGVAIGDLTGDGYPDIFVGQGDSQCQLWINDTNRNFSLHPKRLGDSNTRRVYLGDIEGDGDLDAFEVTEDDEHGLWINKGGGELSNLEPTTANLPAFGASLADFNGDLIPDYMITYGDDRKRPLPVQLICLTVDGTEYRWSHNLRAHDIAAADFDGDGDLDAFVGVYDSPDQVWLNVPEKQTTEPFVLEDSGQELGRCSSQDVGVGDFNDDGHPDVVVANFSTGEDSVLLLNDGDGNFDTSLKLGAFAASAMEVCDLNGDSHLDLVFCGSKGSHILIADGAGGFTQTDQPFSKVTTRIFAVADLDADGDVDFWVAGVNTDHVWRNDGNGKFVEDPQRYGKHATAALCLTDVDGDGDIDAFTGRNDDNPNQIWLNDGTGSFSLADCVLPEQDVDEVAAGDVDGDGKVDLFIGAALDGYGRQEDLIWRNVGDGNFKALKQPLGFLQTHQVQLVDFDNDGDLDAFNAHCYAQPSAIWLNNGDGTFRDPPIWISDKRTRAAALADFDSDGLTDVFMANSGSNPNRVWLNIGTTFPAPIRQTVQELSVTTTDDIIDDADNLLSLREAIIEANQDKCFTRINVPAGTYRLMFSGASEDECASGDLDVLPDKDHWCEIHGVADQTIIEGSGADTNAGRIFEVMEDARLRLTNIIVEGGSSSASGGAIRSHGQIECRNCVFANNTSSISGGAIQNHDEMKLIGCRIVNNKAENNGGGINNTHRLILEDCRIEGNIAANNGGGVRTKDGMTRLARSIVTGNSASNLAGGVLNLSGRFEMAESVVRNNTATHSDVVGIFISNRTNRIGNIGSALGFAPSEEQPIRSVE